MAHIVRSRLRLPLLASLMSAAVFPALAAQAASAELRPAVGRAYSFSIGTLQALVLWDGTIVQPNDGKSVFLGDSQAVGAILRAANLPSDRIKLNVELLLVRAGKRTLLFDTGAGTNLGPTTGRLPESLAAAGIDPASITDIFITHAHPDHVGGLLTPDGKPAFPNSTIHISAPEWAWLNAMGGEAAAKLEIRNYDALIEAMKPRVATFAPGATVIPELVQAIAVEGHTPGHSAYRILSGGASLVDIGDAAHHFILSVGHPGILNAFDNNRAEAIFTRKALLNQLADTKQRVYAGHFPFPGLGIIVHHGATFEWKPEMAR